MCGGHTGPGPSASTLQAGSRQLLCMHAGPACQSQFSRTGNHLMYWGSSTASFVVPVPKKFLLPLLIFFPSFFSVSGFVPVNAIAEYTPSERLFLTQRGRFGGLSRFLAYPESLELVARPWLASPWFLKSPRGAEHQPTSCPLFGFL